MANQKKVNEGYAKVYETNEASLDGRERPHETMADYLMRDRDVVFCG